MPDTEEKPLRQRWVKDTRYYELHIDQDLWGEWVFIRWWGRRGSAMGQARRLPCASYAEALDKLAAAQSLRERRGYTLAELP
jgi:predicted DNA-binding WGR domain protein